MSTSCGYRIPGHPAQDRKDKQATAISLSFVKVVYILYFHLD
jgi:hypothetical protein